MKNEKENQEEIFDIELGEEKEPLEPATVTVKDLATKRVEFEDKDTGKMKKKNQLIFIVDHPSREEPVELRNVEYQDGSTIKNSAIWFYQEESGRIPYNSALGNLLRFYDVTSPNDLKGEDIETAEGSEGYLTIKAH